MERPFASSRPIGPFAQMGSNDSVLITAEFTVSSQSTRYDEERLLEEKKKDLARFVSNKLNKLLGDNRDTKADGMIGNVGSGKGIVVNYDTKAANLNKDTIDDIEDELLDVSRSQPANLEEIIVG